MRDTVPSVRWHADRELIIEQVDGVVHSNVSQFQGQNTPEGLSGLSEVSSFCAWLVKN